MAKQTKDKIGRLSVEEVVLDGTEITADAAELNILDTVTAVAAELNYLDITTLGTGAASKAVVLDAGDDYIWPATGILTYGVLKDPAATTLTSTAAELNVLDGITTTGIVITGYEIANDDPIILVPTRGADDYEYGFEIDSDVFFTGGAAQKSYMMLLQGDRPSGSAATGDSNDAMLKMSYSNRAVNDANYIMRGLNMALSNRGSGVMGILEGGSIQARQRNDGGAMSSLRAFRLDATVNVGGAVPSADLYGLLIEMQLEANMPAESAGITVRNKSDGVYTLPTAAYGMRNDGTSGCKGFTYGIDFYDATAEPCAIAEIRMQTVDAGTLPCIIASGVATDDAGIVADVGADATIADGSLYVSVVDGAGTLWQKRNDVWTSI